jgi:hypothetical protein
MLQLLMVIIAVCVVLLLLELAALGLLVFIPAYVLCWLGAWLLDHRFGL